MANLTITKVTDGYFDFNDDANNTYGGNNISYWYDATNIYFKVNNLTYTYTYEEVSYDDGNETIGFASTIEVISTLKSAGFTGNFNSGGATPQLNTDELDAVQGANNPSASNVFATINDLPSTKNKENIVSGIVASGTNTYTATYLPTLSAYTDGLKVIVRFTNGNTSTATLNLNSLGAKAIVKGTSTALVSGDIPAGTTLLLSYDGTNFIIVGSQLVNQFFDWSPTYGGFSTPPSDGANRYSIQDKLCNFYIAPTVNGTSNTNALTVTLPFNAKNIQVIPVSFCIDNNVLTVGGYGLTTAGSNVLTITKQSTTAFATSGQKRVVVQGWYEIQ
jgi:hypothetical protein